MEEHRRLDHQEPARTLDEEASTDLGHTVVGLMNLDLSVAGTLVSNLKGFLLSDDSSNIGFSLINSWSSIVSHPSNSQSLEAQTTNILSGDIKATRR